MGSPRGAPCCLTRAYLPSTCREAMTRAALVCATHPRNARDSGAYLEGGFASVYLGVLLRDAATVLLLLHYAPRLRTIVAPCPDKRPGLACTTGGPTRLLTSAT